MEQKDAEQEKIANLLRKQGLAASAMAAESMAKDILGNKQLGQKYNELEKAEQQRIASAAPAQGLSEDQVIKVLQKFTDMFTKELERIVERVGKVEKQLDKIQNNMSTPAGEMLSAQSLQEQMSQQEETQQRLPSGGTGLPPLPQMPQQQAPPPAAEASPQPVVQPVSSADKREESKPSHHPRSAAYDPEKYAVDKIFYSGGR